MTALLRTLAPWAPAIGLAVGCALLVAAWNGRRREGAALRRDLERVQLEAAGATVAHETALAERERRLADLAETSHVLLDELSRVRGLAPGSSPVVVASGTTGAVGLVGQGAGGASVQTSSPGPGGSASCPACRLVDGDGVEIRVAGGALETEAGNVAVAAVASAWRVPAVGGEPERLVEAPLALDVRTARREPGPGWGVGGTVVGSRGGWWVGPAVSPPPFSLFGVQLEALLAVGVGSAGEWGGSCSAFARW